MTTRRMKVINRPGGFIEVKPKKSYYFHYGDNVNGGSFQQFLELVGLPAVGSYHASYNSLLKSDEIVIHHIEETYDF